MGTLIRGTVRKTLYSTNVSIHEDAIKHFKNGYLNIQIKESREGKPYIQLNEWEPTNKSMEPLKKSDYQMNLDVSKPPTIKPEPPVPNMGIIDNDDLPFLVVNKWV